MLPEALRARAVEREGPVKIPTIMAAALSGFGASADAATPPPRASRSAQQIVIVLSDFAFTPRTLELRGGREYRLRFVNQGSGGHSFSAPAFFSTARIDPADAPAVSGGEVELSRGESRDVRLVPAMGTYAVSCTHPLHATFGMVGTIVVRS
jgi:plastocyanin